MSVLIVELIQSRNSVSIYKNLQKIANQVSDYADYKNLRLYIFGLFFGPIFFYNSLEFDVIFHYTIYKYYREGFYVYVTKKIPILFTMKFVVVCCLILLKFRKVNSMLDEENSKQVIDWDVRNFDIRFNH